MACFYCHQDYSHHPRCPLAPERKSYRKCELCGEGIYEGDEYIKNDNGEYAHYDCSTTRELIEFFGYELKIMGSDDY